MERDTCGTTQRGKIVSNIGPSQLWSGLDICSGGREMRVTPGNTSRWRVKLANLKLYLSEEI